MVTESTERFAEICKELSEYYFSLAPEPQTDLMVYGRLKKPENDSIFPEPPYDLEYFLTCYANFEEEVNEMAKSKKEWGFIKIIVTHFFNDCLPYEMLLPVEEQFFKERMFDAAELLYNLKIISREINQKYGYTNLINDDRSF